MNTTTLNEIRKFDPCKESWEKLLKSLNKITADDDPLPYKHILDTLGVQDAIWALRTYPNQRKVKLFACDCAENSLRFWDAKYPNDKRPHDAIKAARDYIDGKIGRDEFVNRRPAAAYAADAAAAADAADAADAAADAADAADAYAAADAAYAAAAADAYAAADAAAAADAYAAADADAYAARQKELEWQANLYTETFCK